MSDPTTYPTTRPRGPLADVAAGAWHAREVEDVLGDLAVDPAHGLDRAEVDRRRDEAGANRLPNPRADTRRCGSWTSSASR